MRFEAIVSLNLSPEFMEEKVPVNFPLIKENKYYGCFAIFLNPNQQPTSSEAFQANCSLVENTLACTLQLEYSKPTHNSIKQASATGYINTSYESPTDYNQNENIIDYSNSNSNAQSADNSPTIPTEPEVQNENLESAEAATGDDVLDAQNAEVLRRMREERLEYERLMESFDASRRETEKILELISEKSDLEDNPSELGNQNLSTSDIYNRIITDVVTDVSCNKNGATSSAATKLTEAPTSLPARPNSSATMPQAGNSQMRDIKNTPSSDVAMETGSGAVDEPADLSQKEEPKFDLTQHIKSELDTKQSPSQTDNSQNLDSSLSYILQPDGTYKCSQCDKSFSNKNSIWQHKKTIHENQRFHCHVCSRKFTRKAMLDAHLIKCTTTIGLNYNTYRQSCPDFDITLPIDGSKPLNLCTTAASEGQIEKKPLGRPLKTSPKQNGGVIKETKPRNHLCKFCFKKFRSKRASEVHADTCKLNPNPKNQLPNTCDSNEPTNLSLKKDKYADSLLKEVPSTSQDFTPLPPQPNFVSSGYLNPSVYGNYGNYSHFYPTIAEPAAHLKTENPMTTAEQAQNAIDTFANSIYAKANPFLLAANLLANYKSSAATLNNQQNLDPLNKFPKPDSEGAPEDGWVKGEF